MMSDVVAQHHGCSSPSIQRSMGDGLYPPPPGRLQARTWPHVQIRPDWVTTMVWFVAAAIERAPAGPFASPGANIDPWTLRIRPFR
jgi:hypothetical protein